MDIKTLENFNLGDAIFFHDELNPNLWGMNKKLLPEVKDQLITIAKDFVDELGIKDLDVKDITISGSNAAYSYTKHSDLDLHILVDMSKLPEDDVYREFFTARKNLYNDSHDITIHDVPVELYIQDTNEPVVSLGEYSILKDKWLRIPTKRRANFDQTATKQKYDKLLDIIKRALKSKDLEKIENIISTIKRYRKAGLAKGGEFGPENLAYKAVRTQEYIDKLYKLRDKLHSEELSIEEDNKLLNKPTLTPEQLARKHGVAKMHILKQLDMGIQVELEHTSGREVAREIALDHLGEDPDYYSKLKKAELDEVFNTKSPNLSKWNFEDDNQAELVFTTSNKQKYILDIIPNYMAPDEANPYNLVPNLDDDTYDKGMYVEFSNIKSTANLHDKYSGAKTVTGTGSAAEVFGIVVNALLQYIKKFNPAYLYFQAAEVNRRSLYAAMIKRLITKLPGWKFTQVNDMFAIYNPTMLAVKEDLTNQFASEKTPAINPYGGLKDRQFRGAISEDGTIKPAWRIRFKRFSDLDPLMPERDNKMYFMPLDKSALRTFTSLTGKDFDKIKNMPSEVYEVDGNAMVGDMYIINIIHRQIGELKQYKKILDRPINDKNKQQTIDFIEQLKQQYLESRVPYSQYKEGMFKFPEILAEPSQVRKIEDKGVGYDKDTGEIKITDRKLNEMPDTSGPVGVQPGGWRTYKPRTIDEAFDQPYELKWEKSDYGDYDALAKLDDGTYLSIMFNNEYKKNWMVEFYRNNSQQVTGEGDAQRIFATVLHAIGQFIKKKKPTSLFFSAVKEDDPTGSRAKLYDRLVQRYASSLGYSVRKQEEPGSMSFKLVRNQEVKETVSGRLSYQGNCTQDDIIEHIFGDVNNFARLVDEYGDEFELNDLVVKYDPEKDIHSFYYKINESASGYIPSNAEKNDPRFKTALTVDIKPDTMKKDAKKFGNKISRAGIPPTLNPSGKF